MSNNLPWIADFRDPWTDRFYNYENKRWWITSKLDKVLENSVVNSAQKCVTVSKNISRSFTRNFKVIHIGYDEEDFLIKEANLFYVAITRARENLYISGKNPISEFVQEIQKV